MTEIKIYECPHGVRVIERCEQCAANPATELAAYLVKHAAPDLGCETVELMNEERYGPDDYVVFRDKNGAAVMWMPLRVFEWFRDNPNGLDASQTIVHWDRSKPL